MNNKHQTSFKFLRFPAAILFFLFSVISINAQETVTPSTSSSSPESANVKTGKAPIIIIPGLTGSELVNSKNQEIVWFKPQRSKEDDLRLPISPNLAANKDSLRSRDIIRNIKFLRFLPEIEIYEKLIDSLEKRAGYKEGKWDAPPRDGYQDTFYVFAYDWRLDNVENAKKLMNQMESLKRKLRRPNLKFNIIAHSMGGLIARYATRYGKADLPAGNAKPRVTWAGAKNIQKIFLLGTPNAGSVQALESILNGFSYIGGGLNLPFVQNLSRFDVFTIPSMYQLLPHNGTQTVLDENLKPLQIDYFDIATWEKYDWSPISDDDFEKNFSPAEVKNARNYLIAVLNRARKFQQALDIDAKTSPVSMYLIGGDCKETLDSVVVYRDEKKNKWRTLIKADSFETSAGTKVKSEELKKVIYSIGDGVVSKRSLMGEIVEKGGNKSVLPIANELFVCEGHTKLVTSADAQDKLFTLLLGAPPTVEEKKGK